MEKLAMLKTKSPSRFICPFFNNKQLKKQWMSQNKPERASANLSPIIDKRGHNPHNTSSGTLNLKDRRR